MGGERGAAAGGREVVSEKVVGEKVVKVVKVATRILNAKASSQAYGLQARPRKTKCVVGYPSTRLSPGNATSDFTGNISSV